MWLTAQRTLGRVAELGEREGVMFVLENLNTAVDHPGVPFATAADCLDARRGGRQPAPQADARPLPRADRRGEPHRALPTGAARTSARSRSPTCPGGCEPGTGEIAYPAVARALAEMGYAGTVGLEAWASGDHELALKRFRDAFTL